MQNNYSHQLMGLDLRGGFVNLTPTEKINGTASYSKISVNKIKRQPTDQKNIFTNDTSDKGLIPKIYN